MEKFRLTVDDKGKIEVWMDGCVLKGIRGVELYWEAGEPFYHKVEFITHVAKFERKYSID
jgi:hypothetical protein